MLNISEKCKKHSDTLVTGHCLTSNPNLVPFLYRAVTFCNQTPRVNVNPKNRFVLTKTALSIESKSRVTSSKFLTNNHRVFTLVSSPGHRDHIKLKSPAFLSLWSLKSSLSAVSTLYLLSLFFCCLSGMVLFLSLHWVWLPLNSEHWRHEVMR